MNYNSDFKYDLEFGILNGESWFHELVTDKKIEVKCDRLSAITGNVYIEFESRGKPSGIATTQAEYYVYKYNEEAALIISTEQLKERCRELYRLGLAKKIKGGDDNTSEGLLIKLKDLVERNQDK
jgi:hypothetical protein